MIKKVVIVFMILVWIFQIIFAHLLLSWNPFSQSATSLVEDDIETIQLSLQEEIHWKRKEKEFILNDQLYDVVSIRVEGSSYIIECIADKQETKFFHALVSFLKHLKRNHSRFNLQKNLLINDTHPQWAIIPNSFRRHVDLQKSNYSSIISDIESPPPNSTVS